MLLCSSLVSLLLVHLWCVDNALIKGEIEEREYSILLVMSELSTVRCDRVLVFGCRYTGVECRRRVAVEELRPGGSCGVHSWIEGASGDGRWVS